MTTRSEFRSGVSTFFDAPTIETILPLAAVFFEDDFVGPAAAAFPTAPASGTNWGKKIVGAAPPTVGAAQGQGSGAAALALTVTAEKEDAVLYFLDYLSIDATKIGGFEARFQFPTIPGALTQAVLGVMSAWVDGPDNNAAYLRLGARANGVLLAESYDGVTRTSQAVGTTVGTTTEWHIVRIDWTDPTNVQFWIDGNALRPPALIPFAATGALAILQPYASLYKPSGAGLAAMDVDYVRVWTNRV